MNNSSTDGDLQAYPPRRSLAHRVRGALRAFLVHRHLALIAGLLATLLALPSLGAGLVVDDYFHRLVLTNNDTFPGLVRSPWDMFYFFTGDPAHTLRMIDHGLLPWWTYEGVKAGMWRPITVITHWRDYQLWPDLPVLMHAHSIAWFALLGALGVLFYRRFLGFTAAAGAAALFFALDDARGMPVGFIANRNALVATVFGILAILVHDWWRRRQRPVGGWLAAFLLALSLLSGEMGLSTCAYLAAYALCLERGPLGRRLMTLLPATLVVVAWRITWETLGYGVLHVGFYVDPLFEPLRYAGAVVERAPVLLLGQWALPPADIGFALGPSGRRVMWVCAMIVVLLLGRLMWPLLRSDRTARFFAVGMLISLLPICATFASDRLLFFVGLGAFGLIGRYLYFLFEANTESTTTTTLGIGGNASRTVLRIAGILLVFIHGVLGPLVLPIRAWYPTGPIELQEHFFVNLDFDESIAERTVILMNPPSVFHALNMPVKRAAEGLPVPAFTRILAPGYPAVTLQRTDEHTILVRPEGGYLRQFFDQLFRSENHPLRLGHTVQLTGLTITVTDLTDDGRPAEATMRFRESLDDPDFLWLLWDRGSFQIAAPPKVGETLDLRPTLSPRLERMMRILVPEGS